MKTKSKRPIHYFSKKQIAADRNLTPLQIVTFLENFRCVAHGIEGKSKAISVRVPENLLALLKSKAERQKIPYQTLLVDLIRQYVKS